MFNITYLDVLNAYLVCRKRKRKTQGQLEFEINLEENLYNLWQELRNMTYKVGKSDCFCVRYPKIREIFAARFRDRIVHHLIMNKFLPVFENIFIDSTYSCRKGKGVWYGVKDIEKQVKQIGPKCWYVKLDISGFFMSIQKNILWEKLKPIFPSDWWWLIREVVFNRCQDGCEKKGNLKLWSLLPAHRSLLNIKEDFGIPIGNLTSQIFANFYLTDFDKYIKSKIQGYGRYVDDIILLDSDKRKLKKLIVEIRKYLSTLNLKLNERKTIVQKTTKGILFTGYIIKPHGIYCGPRLYKCIEKIKGPKEKYFRRVNSYLGFLKRPLEFSLRYRITNLAFRTHNFKTVKNNYKIKY